MIQKNKRTFYGHGITTIGINLFVGTAGPLYVFGSIEGVRNASPIEIVFASVSWLIFGPFILASASYLCYEIKHVLFKDGIADDSVMGKIAFSLMSLIGYISGVATILILVGKTPHLPGWFLLLEIIPVSFVSALGGALGLCDVYPHELIFPDVILKCVIEILTSKLVVVVILMTILLSIGSGLGAFLLHL